MARRVTSSELCSSCTTAPWPKLGSDLADVALPEFPDFTRFGFWTILLVMSLDFWSDAHVSSSRASIFSAARHEPVLMLTNELNKWRLCYPDLLPWRGLPLEQSPLTNQPNKGGVFLEVRLRSRTRCNEQNPSQPP